MTGCSQTPAVEVDPRLVSAIEDIAVEALKRSRRHPVVIGLCGAQGSGKTTLARVLVTEMRHKGIAAASLSLDDLYLPRAERMKLARDVHPLLITRGVPGTHDVPLGLSILGLLDEGQTAFVPRFDKAEDDRMGRDSWVEIGGGCEVLIFEGWCVGAVRQESSALATPVNGLEAVEDPDCVWRSYVNEQLGGPYRALFDRIDRLVLLAAPNFEIVLAWRLQQERELAEGRAGGASRIMEEPELSRFVSHYERLTRHVLEEMANRADLTAHLDSDRNVLGLERGNGGRTRART